MCNNKNGEGVKNSSSPLNEIAYFSNEEREAVIDSIISTARRNGVEGIILNSLQRFSDATDKLHEEVNDRKESDQYLSMMVIATLFSLPIPLIRSTLKIIQGMFGSLLMAKALGVDFDIDDEEEEEE